MYVWLNWSQGSLHYNKSKSKKVFPADDISSDLETHIM